LHLRSCTQDEAAIGFRVSYRATQFRKDFAKSDQDLTHEHDATEGFHWS
jgi:hypothetical protein